VHALGIRAAHSRSIQPHIAEVFITRLYVLLQGCENSDTAVQQQANMQVIDCKPALKLLVNPSLHVWCGVRRIRAPRTTSFQQKQQHFGKLAQHPHKAQQHTPCCKVMGPERSDDVVPMQDVPLIPLKVLLGNMLYSNAKVGTAVNCMLAPHGACIPSAYLAIACYAIVLCVVSCSNEHGVSLVAPDHTSISGKRATTAAAVASSTRVPAAQQLSAALPLYNDAAFFQNPPVPPCQHYRIMPARQAQPRLARHIVLPNPTTEQ
jgi:hypothetical protein